MIVTGVPSVTVTGTRVSIATARRTHAPTSIWATLGGGNCASRAYDDMKRESPSDRPAITVSPRITSVDRSAGAGSRPISDRSVWAIDWIGASELLISWLNTRTSRRQAAS